MDFVAVVDQVIVLLRQRGRMTYRTLQRQFQLDDDALHDLTEELLYTHPEVRDDAGRGLVWTGDAGLAPVAISVPVEPPGQAPLTYTPSYLAEKILTSRRALEGERKHVTVLFADLKDSTELIRGLDPEAAQQLLDPALHHMMDAVHRFEGTVNQVLGDGIMALFGAPIAHEDHALRACYAALAMQAAMQPYTAEVRRTRGLELRMRVGLNAGEVVVRAIGNDLHMDYSAVGETTVLAARMEQTALPGTIRLSAATLRLVEGLVQVTALGPVPVKGLAEPVVVFELVGASPLRRRLQAAAARGLTPFVGRRHELAAVHHALAQAQAGHGQVVALVGEAGVGKSRLVYEVLQSYRAQGWRILESASVSYGKSTPYFPVLDLLRCYCQIDAGDAARTIRARVTGQVLTLDETLQDTLPALLALLDVLPDDNLFAHLDPPQRRQRTLEALRRVLLRESQEQPLLLVFEDLHWIDSETQALLDRLVESLPTAYLLLLVNYRPEYQHGWGSKTYYTQLRLDPLPPASAEAFLAGLLGDDPSLAPLLPLFMARTAGNPFFLEESVRTLVETAAPGGHPRSLSAGRARSRACQVPATVQAVLAARIDRLAPEEKGLLQTAAVLGTDVPFALLRAIADVPEAALHRSLAHLQAAEFLYETRLFPEPEYTFKHALTHEVAYGSLLLERRRRLHARLVEAIEVLVPDRRTEVTSGRSPDQVERLAHHALRGEVWDKAVTYCQQAGARAYDRAAFREAVVAFEQALQALVHLPETGDTRVLAIDIHLALGDALTQLGEHGRRLALLGEAEALARALDDQARLGWVLSSMALVRRITGDLDGAMAASRQALDLAVTLGDRALQAQASLHLGLAYAALGDFGRAAELLRRNVETADRHAGTPSTNVRLQSQALLARTLGALGAFAEGRRHGEEALRLATLEGRGATPIVVHGFLSQLYLAQGDLEYAIRVCDQGLTLSRASGSRNLLAAIVGGLGYAYALQGCLAEGRALLEEAISESISTGTRRPILWAWLSESCRRGGHDAEALQHARQALDLARQQKDRGDEALRAAPAWRCPCPRRSSRCRAGRSLLPAGPSPGRGAGHAPLQAHCHRGLGTLYATTGQREQARAALATAIEMYRGMEMTFWLPETEAALAQVEGR